MRIESVLIIVGIVLCFFIFVNINYGQSPYRFDVIGTSNATQAFNAESVSINNNGEISFIGKNNPGGGLVFTDFLPNQPKNVYPNFANNTQSLFSQHSQINDNREILFQTKLSPPGFLPNYTITRLDAKLTALNNTTIAFSNLNVTVPAQPSDFDDLFDTGIAINNNRYGVFLTRPRFVTTNSNLTSAISRLAFATRVFSPSFGPELRPMISDADTIVYRNGNTLASSIVAVPANNQITPEVIIAQSSSGLTEIGRSPSISKKDEAIAFYGNLNAAGAATLGTTAGVGIFVSLKLTSGQRKIIRMGGRLVENNLAPGGNNDGICDLGETCIPGELGFNQAGNPIFFNSFDTSSRVDVGYIESGKRGIDDDIVFVSFLGTPNIASDAVGQIFSSQKGLWTISAKITADSGGGFIAEKPEKPVKVAQIGDTISGKVLTDISVYDQMANNKEKIAFYGATATGNMVIRAVIDRTPVIFVPGIAGSELRNLNTNQRLWFPESISNSVLPLSITNDVKSTDAMRKFSVGLVLGAQKDVEIYNSLLNSFKNNGYVEYNLDGDESRRNTDCGFTDAASLQVLQAKHPTLFVFPYDWRKSNGGNQTGTNIDKLKNYIQCVQKIYPNTNVNIVAHSMGGLLSRSYILQNPGQINHRVKNLITIGTPWLGAVRGIHAIETGSFLSDAFAYPVPGAIDTTEDFGLLDILFASEMKELMQAFPSGSQLLPSSKYFDLGGNPLRVDGINYNFAQTKDWIDSRHPNYNPGTVGANFHTILQDDFRNDTTGVNYYHIYGKQPHNTTVGRIEPRTRGLTGGGGGVAVYEEILPFATAGDGTVPIISASRRTATENLNATCGDATDKRCIGVCYDENIDIFGKLSNHNGMTENPQVQSQLFQILRYADGLIVLNPSFETVDCHLQTSLNFQQSPSYPLEVESHYLTTTGILNIAIVNAQGRDNGAVSSAYKKSIPGVKETVIGSQSMQIITPTNNTYTMRFTGNGQPTAIEDIRGVTNELSAATYIVRYDDLVIQNGVVSEIKIVNNQVESLKYDSNNDGMPDTIIPPSRIITNPQAEDLQAPQATLSWGKRLSFARRVVVNATDNSSGVKRIYYKSSNWTGFQSINGNLATFSVSGLSAKTIQIIAEDNAGNRSNVVSYVIPKR